MRRQFNYIAKGVTLHFRKAGGEYPDALICDYREEGEMGVRDWRVRPATQVTVQPGEYLVDLILNPRGTAVFAINFRAKDSGEKGNGLFFDKRRQISPRDLARRQINSHSSTMSTVYRRDGAVVHWGRDLPTEGIDPSDIEPLILLSSPFGYYTATRDPKFSEQMVDADAAIEIDWLRDDLTSPRFIFNLEERTIGRGTGRRRVRFEMVKIEDIFNLPWLSTVDDIDAAEKRLTREIARTFSPDKIRNEVDRGLDAALYAEWEETFGLELQSIKWAANAMRQRINKAQERARVERSGAGQTMDRLFGQSAEPTSAEPELPTKSKGKIVQCPNPACGRNNRVATDADLTKAVCAACKADLTPTAGPDATQIQPWEALLNAEPPTGNKSKRTDLAKALLTTFGCDPQTVNPDATDTLEKVKSAFKVIRMRYSQDLGTQLIRKISCLQTEE